MNTSKCPRCHVALQHGLAILEDTLVGGMPDFPGDTISSRGQTVSLRASGQRYSVMKCPKCGYSREITLQSSRETQMEDKPDEIMQFFEFEHLPEHLAVVSEGFHALAWHVHATLPRCAERSVALRKLLEGKDAAVRAKLSGK